MQVFLQIFPRYLCSHGLAATAWFWQPYCQPGSWGPVSSLGGVFRPSCTSLRLPRQEHAAGSGILGFLARQMLKHHANRAQGCGSQSPINWGGVFCQEPELYGRQWTLSGDIAKGLCAEAGRQPLWKVFETWLFYYSRIKEILILKTIHILGLKTILSVILLFKICFVPWILMIQVSEV